MPARLTDRQKELDSWSETKLQRHVCDVVEGLGGWWNFFPPCRQGKRVITTGHVAMPDLTIWFPWSAAVGIDGRGVHLVELKATGGVLKPSQEASFPTLRASGQPVYVWWARDFDNVMVPALTWWAGQGWHGSPEHSSRFAQMGRTDTGYVDMKP